MTRARRHLRRNVGEIGGPAALRPTSAVDVVAFQALPFLLFDADGIRDALEIGGLYASDEQAEAVAIALSTHYRDCLLRLCGFHDQELVLPDSLKPKAPDGQVR